MAAQATTGPAGPQKKRTYTLDSGGTLAQGYGMIQGALDESCANPTGAGQMMVGVVDYLPFNLGVLSAPGGGGDPTVSIVQKGEVDAIAGAAVTAGEYVVMDAEGRFVASTETGDQVCGIARSSAASAGDHFVLDVDQFIR